MSSMIDWATAPKNRRFKCYRRPLELSAVYILFHTWWVGEAIGGVLRVLVSLVELMRGVSHDVCFKSKLSHSLHLRPRCLPLSLYSIAVLSDIL